MVLNIAEIDGVQFTKNSISNDLFYFANVYGIRADKARATNTSIIASFEALVNSEAPANFTADEFAYLRAQEVKARQADYNNAVAMNARIADLADNAPVWVDASFHINSSTATKASTRSKRPFVQTVSVIHPHLI